MPIRYLTRFLFVSSIIVILLAIFPESQKKKGKKGEEEGVQGITSISVNIPAVRLNVTVTDKKGNLIKGLTKDYFKVYEDEKEQKITNFFPYTAPINVV